MANSNLPPIRCYPSLVLALELTPERGLLYGDNMKQEERFWPKVDKSGGKDACWPWLAGIVWRNGAIGGCAEKPA